MRCPRWLLTGSAVGLLAPLVAAATWTAVARAQTPAPARATEAPKEEAWTDPLGRSTPRGTVMGFIEAARAGDDSRAAQYLHTRERRAQSLAQELFAVLDARLPPRLARISDAPEATNPATPNQEVVGNIDTESGKLDIVLERVKRVGEPAPIWLFSQKTLAAIPAVYEEISTDRWSSRLPKVLTATKIRGLRLFDLMAMLIGLPVVYLLTVMVNWGLRRLARGAAPGSKHRLLPTPARLLIVIAAGSWLVAQLPLSLVVRQLWSVIASLVVIASVAWLFLLLNEAIERRLYRRLAPSHVTAAASLLRVLRRTGDILVIFVALMVVLRRFGIDPTPALAGLGVGGIAVALAAQKTLENVIAGASLIFDGAVRVGDFLKMGDVTGTVDHIGLRSTCIRTLDRTVVTIPNGQIASVSLETISMRDKFWFHPQVGLTYETTPPQLQAVVDGIRDMLAHHPAVDSESIRVRFYRLGAFSMDIDIFAYLLARDWNHFMELQEALLFEVTHIVHRAGAAFAFPSQTVYVAGAGAAAAPLPH
jgi:MscS family membrane protein